LGVPRFDVVLRGYDRQQVDEHLSRVQRAFDVMRAGLDSAHRQAVPAPPRVPGARPRPTPRPRPGGLPSGGDRPDVVGAFTDRMQAILQVAEREAGEIRGKAQAAAGAEEERAAAARAAARAAEETARTSLAELVRQRDAVLADLTRVRGQLEALLSGPTTRITPPTQRTGSAIEARREDSAGQPLPGTPAAPESEPVPAGAEAAIVATRSSAAGRAAGSTVRPGAPAVPAEVMGTAVLSGEDLFRSASGAAGPDAAQSAPSHPDAPFRTHTWRPGAVADPSDAEQAPVAQAVERTTVVPPAEQSAVAPP
jgi:syndecan 1